MEGHSYMGWKEYFRIVVDGNKGLLGRLGVPFTIIGGVIGLYFLILENWPNADSTIQVLFLISSSIIIVFVFLLAGVSQALNKEIENLRTQIKAHQHEIAEFSLKLDNAIRQKADNPEAAYRINSQLFGLYKEKHNFNQELDSDGSMTRNIKADLCVNVEEVKAVEYSIGTGVRPEGDETELSVKLIDFHNNHEVKGDIERLVEEKNKIIYNLTFMPFLTTGQKVSYGIEEVLPQKSFCMNWDELKEKDKDMEWEFISHRVTYPTANLYYSVTFPKDFKPMDYKFDVWSTPKSQQRQVTEFNRLQEEGGFFGAIEAGRLVIKFELDYPIHGLFYVLKWKPPDKLKVA